MRSFEWCGQRWQVIADVTTGEWYRALREVVAPFHAYQEAGDMDEVIAATDAACAFCAGVLALGGNTVNRSVLMSTAARHNATLAVEDQQHIFPHLFQQVVHASSWGDHEPAVHGYYAALFKSDEFDPALGDGPCGCEECRKQSKMDEHCLFRQAPITAFARQLATANPDDVLKFWDAPLYLYRHSQIMATHRGLSMAARTQEGTKKAMRDEQRELFYNRLRNRIHGE